MHADTDTHTHTPSSFYQPVPVNCNIKATFSPFHISVPRETGLSYQQVRDASVYEVLIRIIITLFGSAAL